MLVAVLLFHVPDFKFPHLPRNRNPIMHYFLSKMLCKQGQAQFAQISHFYIPFLSFLFTRTYVSSDSIYFSANEPVLFTRHQ